MATTLKGAIAWCAGFSTSMILHGLGVGIVPALAASMATAAAIWIAIGYFVGSGRHGR